LRLPVALSCVTIRRFFNFRALRPGRLNQMSMPASTLVSGDRWSVERCLRAFIVIGDRQRHNRPLVSIAMAAWFCVGIVGGCRFMGSGGPVSEEMATCRQLAQRGQSAVDQENWGAAEALFAQAVKTYPNDAAARRYYAEALWRRGAQREALRQADEALRLSPDDAAIAVQLGEMHFRLGRLAEARRLANAALDTHVHAAAAWALRGRIAAKQGKLDSALADFHRALQEAPGDRQVLLEIAEVYVALGRHQRALSNLAALMETYPAGDEPARALYLKGISLSAVGRYADAANALAAANARQPSNADVLACLADAQLQAGDIRSATDGAARALAIDPANALARSVHQRSDEARIAALPHR
jgi:tetratricopeptide (TPR) repeat protein